MTGCLRHRSLNRSNDSNCSFVAHDSTTTPAQIKSRFTELHRLDFAIRRSTLYVVALQVRDCRLEQSTW
jgi:hypothetical protein